MHEIINLKLIYAFCNILHIYRSKSVTGHTATVGVTNWLLDSLSQIVIVYKCL